MSPKKIALFTLALILAATLAFAQTKEKATTSSGKAAATKTTASAAGAKLDINTATKDQLEALPGIGAAYSQKIIDGRPYNAKNDLVRRNIIPESTYEKIKDQIVAHRVKGESAAATGKTKPKKTTKQ